MLPAKGEHLVEGQHIEGAEVADSSKINSRHKVVYCLGAVRRNAESFAEILIPRTNEEYMIHILFQVQVAEDAVVGKV